MYTARRRLAAQRRVQWARTGIFSDSTWAAPSSRQRWWTRARGRWRLRPRRPPRRCPLQRRAPGGRSRTPRSGGKNVVAAARQIRQKAGRAFEAVSAIGISYQMHGLVLVDGAGKVLRPSIIWCDSRAVETGEKAFHRIGAEVCLSRLLNSPGNFTASKLAWVRENEPGVFAKAVKAMLPGDYIALCMTGEIRTTPSGLSEGILWDFSKGGTADIVLDAYGLSPDILPEVVPTFSVAGRPDRRGSLRPRPEEGNTGLVQGWRPAQQRVLAERAGPRRGCHDGGDLRRGLWRGGKAGTRPPFAREHLRARHPHSTVAALRGSPVPERDGHPVQVDSNEPDGTPALPRRTRS